MKLNLIAIAGVAMLISSLVISCNDASQSNPKGSEVTSNSKDIPKYKYRIIASMEPVHTVNDIGTVHRVYRDYQIFADSISINPDGSLFFKGPEMSGTIQKSSYRIENIN